MIRTFFSTALLSLFVVGCCHHHHNHEKPMPATAAAMSDSHDMNAMHSNMDEKSQPVMAVVGTAVATIHPSRNATTMPSNSDVTGTVTFTQTGTQVKIVADITGFAPNTTHGFHIHDKGDLSAPDLMSAGGHYNPGHHIHGGPSTSPVHEGDLGNLTADANGAVHYEITVDDISIVGEHNNVIGKSVIIHAKPDDFSTQPTGNSGGRVAGGIIELQK
jgi:Cu-Zn family superoxide dismutase